MAQFIALLFLLLFAGKAFLKEQQPHMLSQTTEISYQNEPEVKLLWSPLRTIQRLYF